MWCIWLPYQQKEYFAPCCRAAAVNSRPWECIWTPRLLPLGRLNLFAPSKAVMGPSLTSGLGYSGPFSPSLRNPCLFSFPITLHLCLPILDGYLDGHICAGPWPTVLRALLASCWSSSRQPQSLYHSCAELCWLLEDACSAYSDRCHTSFFSIFFKCKRYLDPVTSVGVLHKSFLSISLCRDTNESQPRHILISTFVTISFFFLSSLLLIEQSLAAHGSSLIHRNSHRLHKNPLGVPISVLIPLSIQGNNINHIISHQGDKVGLASLCVVPLEPHWLLKMK